MGGPYSYYIIMYKKEKEKILQLTNRKKQTVKKPIFSATLGKKIP